MAVAIEVEKDSLANGAMTISILTPNIMTLSQTTAGNLYNMIVVLIVII